MKSLAMAAYVASIIMAFVPAARAQENGSIGLHAYCPQLTDECIEMPNLGERGAPLAVMKVPAMTIGKDDETEVFELKDSYDRESVSLTLTPSAQEAFARFTRENVGKIIAMVVDGKIVTAPNVNEEITGGRLQLTSGTGGGAKLVDTLPWLRETADRVKASNEKKADYSMIAYAIAGVVLIVGALWFAFGRRKKSDATSV